MKRGFTLVELLVVITIIGLLVVIAVPSGIAISKKIKQKMLDTKIELIENAGISWGQKNESKIPEGTDSCQIDEIKNDTEVTHCIRQEISFLIDNRELEADEEKDGVKLLKNPANDESLNNCGVEIYI